MSISTDPRSTDVPDDAPATPGATTAPGPRLTFTGDVRADPTPEARREEILAAPTFGRFFSDHMVGATWTADGGWHHGRLVPYGPIAMDPATAVLHYAQEIFEGLKAYRWADGSIHAFRPLANAERFARSARRLALPELPPEDFVASIEALVRTDAAWVPGGEETSLYLRPFMYASEAFLGVRPSAEVTYLVIASPVGPYFTGGVKPVSIWRSDTYSRAAVGGTGDAKCGGNYAAGLAAQIEASAHGCDQVVFVDALEHKWVEELGGMNVYAVFADGRIVTPSLTGTILEGITRSSIITLAEDMGLTVEERRLGIDEWAEGWRSGEITEVFACGTAAVVTPIGRLAWEGGEVRSPQEGTGEVTARIRQALVDIQYGRAEDTHGWMHRLV